MSDEVKRDLTQAELYDAVRKLNLLDVPPCTCDLGLQGRGMDQVVWTRINNPKCEQHHPEKTLWIVN